MLCKPSEPCWVFGGKIDSMSPALTRARIEVGKSEGPVLRRRTVSEALERLSKLPSPILPRGTPPGVVRLLRRPLGIYALGLMGAALLIVIDPLDRLEGGLID